MFLQVFLGYIVHLYIKIFTFISIFVSTPYIYKLCDWSTVKGEWDRIIYQINLIHTFEPARQTQTSSLSNWSDEVGSIRQNETTRRHLSTVWLANLWHVIIFSIPLLAINTNYSFSISKWALLHQTFLKCLWKKNSEWCPCRWLGSQMTTNIARNMDHYITSSWIWKIILLINVSKKLENLPIDVKM